MKAFLLAAGKGTRLRPYTDTIPKCLIPIHGTPLLEIWLTLLARHGIREALVNIHHHADQVTAVLPGLEKKTGVRVTPFYETRLLGSGGTLWTNRTFVADTEAFVIAYADNLTNLDLGRMVRYHREHQTRGGVMTMGLFHAPTPSACGIATLDGEDRITAFIEKPESPESDLANAGIYVASPDIFTYFPARSDSTEVLDLGFHVLPLLAGTMYGYLIREYIKDIGTIAALQAALADWPQQTVED